MITKPVETIGGALGLLALPAGSVGFAVLPSSAHLVETKETINFSTKTFDLKVIKSLFYVVTAVLLPFQNGQSTTTQTAEYK